MAGRDILRELIVELNSSGHVSDEKTVDWLRVIDKGNAKIDDMLSQLRGLSEDSER